MKKTWNFSAGPAILPKSVLEKAQHELLSYENSGMSVMELSHRSSLFQAIIDDAEAHLRQLMSIPDNYKVLFIQGGATLQFAAVPLNLLKDGKAGYIVSGSWGEKAYQEAATLVGDRAVILANTKENKHTLIPEVTEIPEGLDYIHITTNNTIEGTAYQTIPTFGDVPVVADMSSNILSANYNVSDFGLIYAGAQKNIGPAGVTIVIVREDLLQDTPGIPTMLDYKTYVSSGSMYNTPPTFAIYMAKLVFEWLIELGGVSEMVKINQEKAGLLYQTIEESDFYQSPVQKEFRSLTNIPFTLTDDTLTKDFLKEAQERGFVNLKGHRSVGGMRASLYNAFPLEGVQELVAFMKEFEENRGAK